MDEIIADFKVDLAQIATIIRNRHAVVSRVILVSRATGGPFDSITFIVPKKLQEYPVQQASFNLITQLFHIPLRRYIDTCVPSYNLHSKQRLLKIP